MTTPSISARTSHAVVIALLLAGCTALTGLDDLETTQRGPVRTDKRAAPAAPTDGGVLAPHGGGDRDSDSATGETTAPIVVDTSDDEVEDDVKAVPATPPPAAPGPVTTPSFCATIAPAPALCRDFDDGLATDIFTGGSGTVAFDTEVFRSGVRSLRFDVASTGKAFFQRSFAETAASEIRLSFSVHASKLDVGLNDYELAVIKLGRYEVQLERGANGQLKIEEEQPLGDGGATETNTPIGTSLALDMWKRIEMKLLFTSTGSAVEVTVEGTAAPYRKALQAHRFNAPPKVQIGNDSLVNAATIRYDDLVLQMK